jgi:uncharacterized repeat protein (TIGR01451 family)
MNRIIRTSLSLLTLLILSACNLFATPAAVPGTSPVRLTVQTQNNTNTFSRAGEVITYQYVVTNTGNQQLAGPVIITDAPRQANCPNVNTVGNLDPYLNLNETLTCTAAYTVTEADINSGSIMNLATATVGGVISNQAGVTLTRGAAPLAPSLSLAKSASSPTYGQIGQTITYTFVLTNTGASPLGPAQFTITDSRLGAPFNCGLPNTTIAPGQSMNCTANYLITQEDLASANLTNTATASGGGQTSAPATTTITNQTLTPGAPGPIATTPPPSNLSPGSTIQHPVAVGEWLLQIARCYGASINEVRAANTQIRDPNVILPAMTITVPRIGSAGPIHGAANCVVFHQVRSGDTWTSIQQQYNACLSVLQRVNPGGLVVGGSVKVPRNSATLYCPGSTSPTTPNPAFTSTPTPTGTTTPAQRITIDAGQTTASRIGFVALNERIVYVLNAPQGQILTVRLTATPNEVAIGVNGPTGLILKPLDPTPTWTTTVTTGGDHYITLAGVLGSANKSYTLEVSLTNPVTPTFTPTATATNTPGP